MNYKEKWLNAINQNLNPIILELEAKRLKDHKFKSEIGAAMIDSINTLPSDIVDTKHFLTQGIDDEYNCENGISFTSNSVRMYLQLLTRTIIDMDQTFTELMSTGLAERISSIKESVPSCNDGISNCEPIMRKPAMSKGKEKDVRVPLPNQTEETDPSWTGSHNRGRANQIRTGGSSIAPRSNSTVSIGEKGKESLTSYNGEEWIKPLEQSLREPERARIRTDVVNLRKRKKMNVSLDMTRRSRSGTGLRELKLVPKNDVERLDPSLPQLQDPSIIRRYRDPQQRTDYLLTSLTNEGNLNTEGTNNSDNVDVMTRSSFI